MDTTTTGDNCCLTCKHCKLVVLRDEYNEPDKEDLCCVNQEFLLSLEPLGGKLNLVRIAVYTCYTQLWEREPSPEKVLQLQRAWVRGNRDAIRGRLS